MQVKAGFEWGVVATGVGLVGVIDCKPEAADVEAPELEAEAVAAIWAALATGFLKSKGRFLRGLLFLVKETVGVACTKGLLRSFGT